MTHKTKDYIISLVAFIFGTYYILTGLGFPISDLDADPGPGVFPILAGSICALCGILLALKKGIPHEEKHFLNKEQWFRLTGMFLVYVLLWLGLIYLGYFPTVPIIIYIICTLMAGKGNSHWQSRVLYAALVSTSVYFFFQNILDIRLPSGMLF